MISVGSEPATLVMHWTKAAAHTCQDSCEAATTTPTQVVAVAGGFLTAGGLDDDGSPVDRFLSPL